MLSRGKEIIGYQGMEYRKYSGSGINDRCKKYNVGLNNLKFCTFALSRPRA